MFAPWSEPPLVTAPLLLGYATEPVRIRMQGGVGAGGEKPPATRFINSFNFSFCSAEELILPESKESFYLTQFSISKPSILLNSFSLFVTKINSLETACDPIRISIFPIIVPFDCKSCLILPYSYASF
jgi:hypothetical protein